MVNPSLDDPYVAGSIINTTRHAIFLYQDLHTILCISLSVLHSTFIAAVRTKKVNICQTFVDAENKLVSNIQTETQEPKPKPKKKPTNTT